MQLIENWKEAHKQYVVWVLAAIAAVDQFWLGLSPEVLAGIPDFVRDNIVTGLAVVGIVVRQIKQFYDHKL